MEDASGLMSSTWDLRIPREDSRKSYLKLYQVRIAGKSFLFDGSNETLLWRFASPFCHRPASLSLMPKTPNQNGIANPTFTNDSAIPDYNTRFLPNLELMMKES
ncbi:unnamed protein product [Citrullus colocynthis]|uniref:Uncharacterized protein n=1 Tax=Citrullus colocynthis TaxID=252529 RepID=A0ABP0Y807_9ROSI